MRRILACLVALALSGAAKADTAGEFDYYVLALSWTPNWCAAEGDARRDERCRSGAKLGWGVHGLWPQYERGYPEYCRSRERDPSRQETAAMRGVVGSAGLAWHQWKKHGRCTGLSPRAYFQTTEQAYNRLVLPEIFERLRTTTKLPALVVEEAFLEVNPDLRREMITVTCRSGAIQEIRLCLTKDLAPRRCGADVIRDCTLRDAEMAPVR